MHEKPLNMACHVVRTPSVELLLLPGLVAGCSYGWGGQQSQLQLKPVVSLSFQLLWLWLGWRLWLLFCCLPLGINY